VTFHGRVSNDQKYSLVGKAHILLMPGVREGWGLVVTEANAMGTPAVAYDIAGVRDAVVDGVTGILTDENSPEDLARKALDLLRSPQRLRDLSENALEFSRKFSWDITAEKFEEVIERVMAGSNR
jgi:glycosyltransferase involved in cell wall biosynthesis